MKPRNPSSDVRLHRGPDSVLTHARRDAPRRRFDPVFFLHHCNVDRVYEAYLREHPDSAAEMAAMQRQLKDQRGEEDRFLAPLHPFKHPITRQPAVRPPTPRPPDPRPGPRKWG